MQAPASILQNDDEISTWPSIWKYSETADMQMM